MLILPKEKQKKNIENKTIQYNTIQYIERKNNIERKNKKQ